MTLAPQDADRITREGVIALRAGDARGARDRFRQVVDHGGDFRPPWFLLAQACRQLADDIGERGALTRFLNEEPRHLAALLMMADLTARTQDDRAAVSFYRTALAVAAQPGAAIPPALRPMLAQAETFVAAAGRRFAAHLSACVTGAGLARGRSGDRVRQSIDLLLGQAQLYLQQPSMFYFPGLPQRQFFDRDEFDWLPASRRTSPQYAANWMRCWSRTPPFVPMLKFATVGRCRTIAC